MLSASDPIEKCGGGEECEKEKHDSGHSEAAKQQLRGTWRGEVNETGLVFRFEEAADGTLNVFLDIEIADFTGDTGFVSLDIKFGNRADPATAVTDRIPGGIYGIADR